MKREVFSCRFADYTVNYSFLFEETARYFGNRLTPAESGKPDIRMSEEHFAICKTVLNDRRDGYIEYKGLITLTSQYLLQKQCCILHGVSFIYKDKAWLLCAPSGTGKTTQYRNWHRAHPDEITVISGDMPLLQLKNNRIYVHPTPWNGKEGYCSDLSAPLGGIICLKQGNQNMIRPLLPSDGVIRIFNQLQTVFETEEEIQCMARITQCIFDEYPVMFFTNDGSAKSTEFLRAYLNEVSDL